MKESEASLGHRLFLQALEPGDGVSGDAALAGASIASWERAVDLAQSLDAVPPFARAVEGLSPEPVRLRLERLERRDRIKLALLDAELELALGALIELRIEPMLLKGADLGRRFYPDRSLRPMGDIDLLVRPEDYPRAWSALRARGFAPTETRYRHSFRSALSRDPEGASIDLHFGLIAGDTRERLARLWERSVAGAFGDLPGEARALSVEDCLVYVLRHSAILHVMESPVWLRDLHAIVEASRDAIDWDFVTRELAETRSQAAGFLVFGMLARQWRTPVPAEALRALERGAGLLRRTAAPRYRELAQWFPEEGRSRLWMLRSRFLLRDGAADAARFAWERWLRKRHERTSPGL